ncbi:MAG: AI-2E family transporter [Synechococcaceae cyanobacterium ELA445]
MSLRDGLSLAAILAATALLWSLREVLVLLFAAVVLAMALCTLVGAVQRRSGVQRPLALLLSLLGLLVLFLVVATVVVPPFMDQFGQLIAEMPRAAQELLDLLRGWMAQGSRMIYGRSDGGWSWLQQSLPIQGPSGAAVASGVGAGALRLLGLAGNLGTGLVQLLFVIAVGLMVTAQPVAYREAGLRLLPSFYRRRARQVLVLCGTALSSWMVGVLISSCCVALLAGLGLMLLGVKLVVANALLAGLLNIIPNVGPSLSTIFPMAVAVLDTPWRALAVVVLYVVVQNLESYLITPSVMHAQVQLLPGFGLLAQFVFTVLFGPLGLLLALPMAVCLQVILREAVIHDFLDPWKRRRLSP